MASQIFLDQLLQHLLHLHLVHLLHHLRQRHQPQLQLQLRPRRQCGLSPRAVALWMAKAACALQTIDQEVKNMTEMSVKVR